MAMFSLIPAFTGMLALSLLPTDSMKWTRWGMYILQVFGTLPGVSKYPSDSPISMYLGRR
jgi:ACS family allantoate permease-like MFS transporter